MIKTQNDIKELVINNISNTDFSEIFVVDALNGIDYSYDAFFNKCDAYYREILLNTENSRIVCVLDNSIELFAMYFAVMLSNKRIVVIDPQKGKQDIDLLLDSIPDKFVVVDDKSAIKVVYYDYIFIDTPIEKFNSFENVKNKILQLLSGRNFESDYLLTFTSGTTGINKGVRHSLGNLFWTAYEFNKCFNVGDKNIFGHFMPMTYMAGILNTIIQPFLSGSKIVLMGKFTPIIAISFWQNVIKYKINTFWLSPAMLTLIDKLSKEVIGAEYCKNNNVLFFIGTAPLSDEFKIKFEKKYKIDLYASYGLSETLYLSTETPKTKERRSVINVGALIHNVDYVINEDSELQVDVPWMFLGYSNENTDLYFNQKYYKTGDFALVENGMLTILGRKKDLIVRGGFNISPLLIENVVNGFVIIDECAVFGIYNTKNYDENIILAYTLRIGTNDVNLGDINNYVLEKLDKNYLIDDFFYIDHLPKNLNGKIDKKSLKEIYINSKSK